MPYLQSQHVRDPASQAYGWAASSQTQAIASPIDLLTGLPTLKEFYRRGQPLVRECLSQRTPCAVVIIDVDHFRRLRETYCEESIDQVLKAIAAKLGAACDGSPHLLARLDEEQFGIFLRGLDGAAAMNFCERLRLGIAALRFPAEDADFSVTVSIGLAKICGPENFDNYLNAAEQFLFMAKSHGRNQVFSELTVALQTVG